MGFATKLDQAIELLAHTVLAVHHGRRHGMRRTLWRLKHKIHARISHYQRRSDPLPAILRKWMKCPEVILI